MSNSDAIPSPVPRGSSTLYDFGVGVGILAAAGELPLRRGSWDPPKSGVLGGPP